MCMKVSIDMEVELSVVDEVAEATIHIRTTAALKGRWVRISRQEGIKLGEWIVGRVEQSLSDGEETQPKR